MAKPKAPARKMTQKQKVERGNKGEGLVTKSLAMAGLWNNKLINGGYGTVFDKLIIPPAGGWAVEVKTRKKPLIAYNPSSITQNERKGLDRFMELVGDDRAVIIGIWLTDEFRRAFVIPWKDVRDAVCSGQRGSIKMTDWPELPRTSTGWDMSLFGRQT